MPTTDRLTKQTLEQRRTELKAQLAQVGDLRPGSLVERYRRCGKAGCHCAAETEGHGPSWSLTRAVGGKTVTRIIPADAVERTRQHVAEYQRFRGLVRDLVETSEQLCDAKLHATETATDQAAKKGAPRQSSKKPSPRTSSRRSRRL
jgi:uncharacterized protein DUF6788